MSKLDAQDALIVGGSLSLIGGAGEISRAAGLIVAGLLCFAFVFMIERAKGKRGPTK